jgi:SAM-dependent methyltransferase
LSDSDLAAVSSRPEGHFLTEDDVVYAFRTLFDRDPESGSVIAEHIRLHRDPPALWRSMMDSDEFRDRHQRAAIMGLLHSSLHDPAPRIDHEVSDELMGRMMERVAKQWTLLGEDDPHWSVLTDESFRSHNLDEATLDRFRESGAFELELLERIEARTQVPGSRGVCIELGCGVGRITRHLATRFEKVIAVDISPGNLRLCREYMAEVGLTNVETVLVQNLQDFESLPEADYFYSVIVLQHNPPPIQKAILRRIFSLLRPGGGVLFQVPTLLEGYEFVAAQYLEVPPPVMEVHCLPRSVVLAEMQDHGIRIVDMMPDARTGEFGSYTFYGVKRSAA